MTDHKNNILLLLASTILTLIIIEVSLGIYYSRNPQTTGVCAGKICKSWLKQNWRTNGLGFRDKEWNSSEKQAGALFIGDSFAAGFGVREIDRYSNVADANNNSGIKTYNAGNNNSNTIDEYRSLKNLTPAIISPKFVVYQYLGNDIEYLFDLDWLLKPSFIQKAALYFIENSFLFDMVLRPFYLKEFRQTYQDKLVAAYKDPETFSKHQGNIKKIFDHIRKIEAKNIFVPFPMLGSKEVFAQTESLYVKNLEKFFRDNCYPGDKMVKLSPLLYSIPSNKWTASKFDSHPSSIVHNKIGEVLADAFDNKKNKYLFSCSKQ